MAKPADNALFGNQKKEKDPSHAWRRQKHVKVVSEYKKDFNGIVRELRDLAMPHINKFARKDYEMTKIAALGGKIEKRRKMPLPELKARRAKADERVAKQLAKEQASGVKIRINKNRDVYEAKKQRELKEKRFANSKIAIDRRKMAEKGKKSKGR